MTRVRLSEWVQFVKDILPLHSQRKSVSNSTSQRLKPRLPTHPPYGIEQYPFRVCGHAVHWVSALTQSAPYVCGLVGI